MSDGESGMRRSGLPGKRAGRNDAKGPLPALAPPALYRSDPADLLDDILALAPCGLLVVSPVPRRIVRASAEIMDILGRTPGQALSSASLPDLPDILPDLASQDLDRLLCAPARRRPDGPEIRTRLRRRDGTCLPARLLLRRCRRTPGAVLVFVLDLPMPPEAPANAVPAPALGAPPAPRPAGEEFLDRLEAALEALPDGFALYGPDDRLVFHNRRYREIDAADPALNPRHRCEDGLPHGLARGICPGARSRDKEWLTDRLAPRAWPEGMAEMKMSDGRWFRFHEGPTPAGDRVVLQIDITELREKQKEFEEAALLDALTGLPNRRGLASALAGLDSAPGRNGALEIFHVDLDRFKAINDLIGHDAGDFVLRRAAAVLCKHVTPDGVAARVGGDEFVLVCPGPALPGQMIERADAIRRDISEPVVFTGRICHIGASIGVSVWRGSAGIPIEQALSDADIALLHGKSDGRNRTVLFDPAMREETLRKTELAAALRAALREQRIEAVYQPQIDAVDGSVTGLEVLMRWRQPDGTLLEAEAFREAAEMSGLIRVIDERMIGQGLDLAARLAGAGRPVNRMGFNLSAATLADAGVCTRLVRAVAERGLAPGRVSIEIGEDVVLERSGSRALENVLALTAAGFRIEIDDFGTGHTALASLMQIPVDRIKLDTSLVRGIEADPQLRAISGGLIGLAARLGIAALAEGVESAAEAAVLRAIGVDTFQGFHFAAPMSCVALDAWLADRGGHVPERAADPC